MVYDTHEHLEKVRQEVDDVRREAAADLKAAQDSNERRLNETQKEHTRTLGKVFEKLDGIQLGVEGLRGEVKAVNSKMDGLTTTTQLAEKVDALHLWTYAELSKCIDEHEHDKHDNKNSNFPGSIKITLPVKILGWGIAGSSGLAALGYIANLIWDRITGGQ
jgi:chromosome segregation ATPase